MLGPGRGGEGTVCVCVFITGGGESQIKGNKYGSTRSAGDYRRKVQLARLCAWGGQKEEEVDICDHVSLFAITSAPEPPQPVCTSSSLPPGILSLVQGRTD